MFWLYFEIIKKPSLSLLRRVTQYMLINPERFWEFQIEFSCIHDSYRQTVLSFENRPVWAILWYVKLCRSSIGCKVIAIFKWFFFGNFFFSRILNTLWLGSFLEFILFQVYFCNFKLSFLPIHDSFSKSRTGGFQFGEPPVMGYLFVCQVCR